MLLLQSERRAVFGAICRHDHQSFRAAMMLSGGPAIGDFSSSSLRMEGIAADFVDWLNRNAKDAPNLLDGLAASIGRSEEGPVLQDAASRLRSQAAKLAAAGECTQASLVTEGVPMVDREVLRDHRKRARIKQDIKLVKVMGETGLGRSHSWFLIKHVAKTGAAEALKFDLVSATLEKQTLDTLFGLMTRELGLSEAVKPTTEGVTADTLAARFADEMARSLRKVFAAWDRPRWLIFDSLDRDLRPEIKRFVALLTRARLEEEFDRCVIFLLGPDSFAVPEDGFRLHKSETLVGFEERDIRKTANDINSLGERSLSATDLEQRIQAMLALRGQHAPRELCGKVAEHLGDLREAVGA